MSYNGVVPWFPEDIVFELMFFMSPQELVLFLCTNLQIKELFQKHNGYSRYAKTIFFNHFETGLKLSKSKIKKPRLQRLANPILSCFVHGPKKMLVNDGAVRKLYKEVDELLNLSDDVSWEEFHEKFLRVETKVIEQEILAEDKYLRLELATRLLHLAHERSDEVTAIEEHITRIICEDLKKHSQGDGSQIQAQSLDDVWCEPDDFFRHILWFYVHNNKKGAELRGRLELMLLHNLGGFGLGRFHEILMQLTMHENVTFPTKHNKKSAQVRLLKWYVRHPKELDDVCKEYRNHFVQHLLVSTDSELPRILHHKDCGVSLALYYIENPAALTRLCNKLGEDGVFVQCLFDIYFENASLLENLYKKLCEDNYDDIFKILPLLKKDQARKIIEVIVEDIRQFSQSACGDRFWLHNRVDELSKIDSNLACFMLDSFLQLPDEKLTHFISKIVTKDRRELECFFKTNPLFAVKIVNRILSCKINFSDFVGCGLENLSKCGGLELSCTQQQRTFYEFLNNNLSPGKWGDSYVNGRWSKLVCALLQNNEFRAFLAEPQLLACFLIGIDARLLPLVDKFIKQHEKLMLPGSLGGSYKEALKIPGVLPCLLSRVDSALRADDDKKCYTFGFKRHYCCDKESRNLQEAMEIVGKWRNEVSSESDDFIEVEYTASRGSKFLLANRKGDCVGFHDPSFIDSKVRRLIVEHFKPEPVCDGNDLQNLYAELNQLNEEAQKEHVTMKHGC